MVIVTASTARNVMKLMENSIPKISHGPNHGSNTKSFVVGGWN
jgi:hypothetical protein